MAVLSSTGFLIYPLLPVSYAGHPSVSHTYVSCELYEVAVLAAIFCRTKLPGSRGLHGMGWDST